jgi:Protein of unknown function (DUF2829)
MNFNEAVNNMNLGKRCMRPGWVGYYVTVMPGQTYIWQIGNTNTQIAPNVNAYVPSLADIDANDWQIKT